MKEPIDSIDRFDQYLDDAMSEQERKVFLEEVENDDGLKKEFDQHRLMIDGIKLEGRIALLDKMQEWDEEIEDQEGVSSGTIQGFRWYYAAASLLFLMVLSWFIYENWNKDYDELVAGYYVPYSYIPETTRGDSEVAGEYDNIYRQYDLKDYRAVISRIEAIDASKRPAIMKFILGNAYQALGEEQKAMPIYNDIKLGNSPYVKGASWYLALCHLSLGQVDSATAILKELSASRSPYSKKAKQLLDDL